ncbi:MAG: imidazolonepropionase [Candidatus Kapabacteria bacterium]|nr:imidazolonepropionase [Candidatus Kapabacteria bacterium]
MKTLLTNIDSLVTVNARGGSIKTDADMRDVGEIVDGALLFDERILWIGPSSESSKYHGDDVEVIDCKGKTVLPGFVDSHTHMVFAGSRAGEFARRLAGESYSDIAADGGGILTTMRAVREADVEALIDVGDKLLTSALEHGSTTVEIKSGYGLDVESELRLLEAIGELQRGHEARVIGTFMGAHAVPPEYKTEPERYVDLVINEMLPKVKEQGVASFCDVFTDAGFFTVEQSERILLAAREHGLRLKVHADEIALIGASHMAARLGCISADHLEHSTRDEISALRGAGVVCTLLPGTAFTLRLPYPDAREMISQGAIVALATDCNPGSCFSENMQTILSLACINMNMSIEEAIVASTLHGAAALGLAEHLGSIEVGKFADIVVYDVPSYKNIVYHFGVNHVWGVWVGGNEV